MMSSCAQDDSIPGPSIPETELSIVDFTPGNKATINPNQRDIIAQFSLPIDPESIKIAGRFSLIEDVNGIAENLTDYLTITGNAASDVITFHINRSLKNRADYIFNVSQNVQSLGSKKNLRQTVSHQFNTGGGFSEWDSGLTVPGQPRVIENKYIRECVQLDNGQQSEKAHIEVRFSEALAYAPVVDIQKTVDFSDVWTILNKPMQQKYAGDMSTMKVEVDSTEDDLAGYKIRFDNPVVDLEGLSLGTYTSAGMYQVFLNCND